MRKYDAFVMVGMRGRSVQYESNHRKGSQANYGDLLDAYQRKYNELVPPGLVVKEINLVK